MVIFKNIKVIGIIVVISIIIILMVDMAPRQALPQLTLMTLSRVDQEYPITKFF